MEERWELQEKWLIENILAEWKLFYLLLSLLHDFHIHLHEGRCVLLRSCCACLLLLYIPASAKELTA